MRSNARIVERRRAAAQMHALAAVRQEIGARDRASGRVYLREFAEAFRDYREILAVEALYSRIAATDIVLVGDYHSLPACQRFVADLIERLSPSGPIVVGLEAILSRDQQILNSWWRREIDEAELRQRLRFDTEWGYDWTPLLEVLVAARDHAEGLYGLDCLPREDLRRIRTRDRHAAGKICELRRQHPKARIVVLFGESHLAPQHLPALLKTILPDERVLTVLQNIDDLYWKAAQHAPAVCINDDAICVFNSTPLEKYESYRSFIEGWDGGNENDFAPSIYNLIFSMARTLGFRLNLPENGRQPRHLSDALPDVVSLSDDDGEAAVWEHLGVKPESGPSFDQTLLVLQQRGCVYVARTNTFFIRELRISSAAAEAARFLFRTYAASVHADTSPNPMLEDTLAYFGARLMSPAESCELLLPSMHGESLYRSYVEGRVTKAAIRRMFTCPIARN